MKAETQEQVGDLLLWSDNNANQLLNEIAAKHGIHANALADLVAWERAQQVNIRRQGMQNAFDEVFDNQAYWNA